MIQFWGSWRTRVIVSAMVVVKEMGGEKKSRALSLFSLWSQKIFPTFAAQSFRHFFRPTGWPTFWTICGSNNINKYFRVLTVSSQVSYLHWEIKFIEGVEVQVLIVREYNKPLHRLYFEKRKWERKERIFSYTRTLSHRYIYNNNKQTKSILTAVCFSRLCK